MDYPVKMILLISPSGGFHSGDGFWRFWIMDKLVADTICRMPRHRVMQQMRKNPMSNDQQTRRFPSGR